MKHNILVFLTVLACFFSFAESALLAQDQSNDYNLQTESIEGILPEPSAIPVATPEEAFIANHEAINAKTEKERQKILFEKEQKKAASLEKDDWNKIDFGKNYIRILLCLVPLSILFSFILKKRIRLHIKTKQNQKARTIRFAYWPLLFLTPIIFVQWLTVFINACEKDFSPFFYEQKDILWDTQDNTVKDGFCQIQVKNGFVSNPLVIVDGNTLQEVSLSQLKNNVSTNDNALCFADVRGVIYLPSAFTGKEVHVFSLRRFVSAISFLCDINKSILACLFIYLFWFAVQLIANKGFSCCYHKTFRNRCLLVFLLSFSFVIAGAFWMSHIPLDIPADGKGYLNLSGSDTIMNCLYGVRTPGYPLFLSFVEFFSPLSFHSLICFQTLIYLLSLSWLLYELYKKGVPIVILLIAYFLFYSFMANFFFKAMCESLEISGIAATTAIGLTLSNSYSKKRIAYFVILLILTLALVFGTIMVKPFPGLIMLPGGMMFLGLFGTIKLHKNILLTILVGILSVIPPATYCTIRWKHCGDWNFASLINSFGAAYQMAITTPQSLNKPEILPEQKELATDIIQSVSERRPDFGDWPWWNSEKPVTRFYQLRLIMNGEIAFYFQKEFDKEKLKAYKSESVYRNARSKALLKVGDQELQKIITKYYWDSVYKVYTKGPDPRWISETLRKRNPYQSAQYFLLTVFLPLLLFCLIAFIPACKRIRCGSWKTVIILIGFSFIPLFTFLGQQLYLGPPIFETRSEMVMFFSTMLGTIILSMYCTYSLIISFTLALRIIYQKHAPKKLKELLDKLAEIIIFPFKCRNITKIAI